MNQIEIAFELCALAYGGIFGGNSEIKKCCSPFKIKDFPISVEGIWHETDSAFYVCFQGSWGVTDWIQNLNFLKGKPITPYPGMNPDKIKVHSGFIQQYMVIRKFIHHLVEEQYSPKKGLIFTGHSLGGALATLASLDLNYNFGLESECITLGSPKIGNRYFKESHESRVSSLRCIYRNDIVPTLPPLIGCYKHVGRPIQFGKRSIFYRTWLDHIPSRYVKALKGKANVHLH